MLEANEKLRAEDKELVEVERMLLGITKASLATESFISAAVLPGDDAGAHRSGGHRKRDHLRGLKENVVVGRLIPAGTGLAYHAERA